LRVAIPNWRKVTPRHVWYCVDAMLMSLEP